MRLIKIAFYEYKRQEASSSLQCVQFFICSYRCAASISQFRNEYCETETGHNYVLVITGRSSTVGSFASTNQIIFSRVNKRIRWYLRARNVPQNGRLESLGSLSVKRDNLP